MLPAGVVALAVIATNLVNYGARLHSDLLDANAGTSWSHRAVAATLAAGGMVALLGALRAEVRRAAWSTAAGALIALFVVESSSLHVQVDKLSYGKLIYAPLLCAFALSAWRLAGGASQAPLVRVGLAALALSYVVHLLGSDVVEALGWSSGSWAYQAKVGLKEGTELGGWLVILVALWRAAHLVERLGVVGKLARWAVGRSAERA